MQSRIEVAASIPDAPVISTGRAGVPARCPSILSLVAGGKVKGLYQSLSGRLHQPGDARTGCSGRLPSASVLTSVAIAVGLGSGARRSKAPGS